MSPSSLRANSQQGATKLTYANGRLSMLYRSHSEALLGVSHQATAIFSIVMGLKTFMSYSILFLLFGRFVDLFSWIIQNCAFCHHDSYVAGVPPCSLYIGRTPIRCHLLKTPKKSCCLGLRNEVSSVANTKKTVCYRLCMLSWRIKAFSTLEVAQPTSFGSCNFDAFAFLVQKVGEWVPCAYLLPSCVSLGKW